MTGSKHTDVYTENPLKIIMLNTTGSKIRTDLCTLNPLGMLSLYMLVRSPGPSYMYVPHGLYMLGLFKGPSYILLSHGFHMVSTKLNMTTWSCKNVGF